MDFNEPNKYIILSNSDCIFTRLIEDLMINIKLCYKKMFTDQLDQYHQNQIQNFYRFNSYPAVFFNNIYIGGYLDILEIFNEDIRNIDNQNMTLHNFKHKS